MKILQINKFFYRRGGADHHFFDLLDLLQKHGETVIPFSMRHRQNLPSPFAKYFVPNLELGEFNWSAFFSLGRIFYSWQAKRKLAKLIKAERPDVAHCHLIYHQLSPSILVALKQAKIPVIATIHDWKYICPNYLLFTQGSPCMRCKNKKYWQAAKHRCMHGKFLPSVIASLEAYFHHHRRYYEDYIDLYIAPSNFVKEMFVNFGWPAKKIVVLPHWLPISLIGARIEPAPATPRFAYVGRLAPEKGAVELVKYWCEEGIPYQLDIYGSGPLFKKIKELISEKNNQQIILRGEVVREKLWSELSGVTATIVPSLWYETFCLSAVESLARGVPVVAHRLGVLTEIVESSQAGELFDWRSAGASLKDALKKIIGHPEYRLAGINYAKTLSTPSEYYEEIMKLYSSILCGSIKGS